MKTKIYNNLTFLGIVLLLLSIVPSCSTSTFTGVDHSVFGQEDRSKKWKPYPDVSDVNSPKSKTVTVGNTPKKDISVQVIGTRDEPDFFTIRYPNMESTASVSSTPIIVSGKNCDLKALTAAGSATYSIAANTIGSIAPALPTINAKTGVVANHQSASPGAYKVTVKVDSTPACNTNVLVYNTITPINLITLKMHLFDFNADSGVPLYGNEGDFNYIITSQITDMSSLFKRRFDFNGDISKWDTSKVRSMYYMFFSALAFNRPLSNWDTSKVENMSSVFAGAVSFNQPLNGWDTSQVTNMPSMFAGNSIFNQPLNGWNTSQVQDMSGMFFGSVAFNQPLNKWNTSQVRSMENMFSYASIFNQPLSNWNTANVESMWSMFSDAQKFDQDLSMWNVGKVTDHDYMFKGSAMQGKENQYPRWKQ